VDTWKGQLVCVCLLSAILLLKSSHLCLVCLAQRSLHRRTHQLSLQDNAFIDTAHHCHHAHSKACKHFVSGPFFHSCSSYCRWIRGRQHALRTFVAVYIGVNALYLYPRYAKEAFSSAWPWLLRYSNAWVLLMTAVGLMVSACSSQFFSCCHYLLKCARFCLPIVCSLVQLSPLMASFGYGESKISFQFQNVNFNPETPILAGYCL